MTLLLDNDDVENVLSMRDSIVALESVFVDYARGRAINRPRSHTYTDLSESWGEGHHYLFKSMDGSVPRAGVHAIRMSSDHTHEHAADGRRRRDKLPLAPGERWVGLILLFDIDTLVPLAILHDGYLQRMRVGATSALAARHLARPDAVRAGLVGTGWQAGAQLLGLAELGSISDYRVFSPDAERCRAFCDEYTHRLGADVRPVATAHEAVAGSDVVALATNAHDPVLDGHWLRPGQHVGSVQGHELDWTTLDRADLIVVRSREEATFHHAAGRAPAEAAGRKQLDEELRVKVAELGDVVTGVRGRRDERDVTLFTGGGTGASSGLGIQFAAVADVAYRAAVAHGSGRELPTEWFTQDRKP
ncbi:MAG: ornithine cyclodeaminase family protein [Nitriliruptorales bacterium]|nr:ornithine cyclodeaminase family protein [Nitriliruptorales bacterium]